MPRGVATGTSVAADNEGMAPEHAKAIMAALVAGSRLATGVDSVKGLAGQPLPDHPPREPVRVYRDPLQPRDRLPQEARPPAAVAHPAPLVAHPLHLTAERTRVLLEDGDGFYRHRVGPVVAAYDDYPLVTAGARAGGGA